MRPRAIVAIDKGETMATTVTHLSAARPDGTSRAPASALAVIREIERRLAACLREGTRASLDLMQLAALPAELGLLRQIMGDGVVRAEVGNRGGSLVRETAIPCVWWVTHRDESGQTLAEFIEIADTPPLLAGDCHDIPAGLRLLAQRSAVLAPPAPPKTSISTQGRPS